MPLFVIVRGCGIEIGGVRTLIVDDFVISFFAFCVRAEVEASMCVIIDASDVVMGSFEGKFIFIVVVCEI